MSTYLDANFRAGRRAPFTLDGLGESQAFYDRITVDQNALTVRLAEITAADQSAWDGVWSALQNQYIPGTASPFTGWGYTKQLIMDTWKTLTPKYTSTFGFQSLASPDGAALDYAEKLLADTANMVAYFKKIVPEQAAQVQADGAMFKQKLDAIPAMRSPEEVGWDTFQTILKERASSLATFGGGGLLVAGGIALGVALLLARR